MFQFLWLPRYSNYNTENRLDFTCNILCRFYILMVPLYSSRFGSHGRTNCVSHCGSRCRSFSGFNGDSIVGPDVDLMVVPKWVLWWSHCASQPYVCPIVDSTESQCASYVCPIVGPNVCPFVSPVVVL